MEEATRLKRGNKTNASKLQRLSQNNGWVMPLNNFENMNIIPDSNHVPKNENGAKELQSNRYLKQLINRDPQIKDLKVL
jgi:hypothetical protein